MGHHQNQIFPAVLSLRHNLLELKGGTASQERIYATPEEVAKERSRILVTESSNLLLLLLKLLNHNTLT